MKDQTEIKTIEIPEPSVWKCELFGTGPDGIVYMPTKDKEPNFFWRWMQYLFLAINGVRNERVQKLLNQY